ncbi:MAG TPA: cellulose binding domain-containing protein [Steroidobacteraceae bacterium]|nr:cellulose binding domain-containing protein [Steroidobacteraceae bacterium]
MEYNARKRYRRSGVHRPATALALALSSMVLGQTAWAGTGDITQTWTLTPGSNPPASTTSSTVFGQANMPSWGYPNLPIPSDGTTINLNTAGVNGNYRVNLNYWNQDITWGAVTTSNLTINVNDQTGAYFVQPSPTSNSYYPGSRPQDNKACAAGAFNSQDVCHWAPNRANPSADPIHAPAAYPSIYNGCHYNQCTKSAAWKDGTMKVGAPYPLQVNQITSIPSHWVVDTSTTKSTAVYDVGYDIWFDKNPTRDSSGNIVTSGGTQQLPARPDLVNQNNGLEIMIWINNKGYTEGGTKNGGIIQPAGNLVASAVGVNGVSGSWDVWVTNSKKSGTAPNDWYVVTYVKVADGAAPGSTGGGTDDFQFDSKWFINDAAGRDCIGEKCLSPSWWLTSVQAGFEIWADGDGLATKSFTAEPTWKATTVQGGAKWKDDNGNDVLDPNGTGNPVPIVYWGQPFQISASCPNPSPSDTGTWTFTGQDPTTTPPTPYNRSGSLTPDPTGILVATIPAMQPAHEWATINVTTNCANGGGGAQPPITLWIDPAGTVKDTQGHPLVGATVTLYRSATATGTFTAVPDGSTIMSDKNRHNPDATGQYGDFSWDVTPGFYKVRAAAPGCHAPGNPNQTFVDSAVYQVPPPALGINLVLDCPTSGGSGGTPGVSVKLTLNGQDWQNGYCRNIVLTNTNNFPVTWKVPFTLPYPGNLTQSWNINYTKAGNTVTAWGVGWNNVLQPKQVLSSSGFCATK